MQVYNYMLENYPMKREVMYPAHKRSDLNRIYKHIVNLNKRSPFYKINLSQENQEYMIGIKERALSLRNKLEDMEDLEKAGFLSRAVSVSNEKVIDAALLSEDTQGLPDSIEFRVEALAKVQKNSGKELLNISKGLQPGVYNFVAQVNDSSYPLTYIQKERMENKETARLMVDFLNRYVPGINVQMEQGSASDYSKITLVSEQAGKNGEKAISFMDEDYMGVVAYFGLDRVEQASEPARFSVNGTERQTVSNTFYLENKLRVTLTDTSEAPVTLNVIQDDTKILSSVETFLDTYNGLIRIARDRMEDNPEHYHALKLLRQMNSLEEIHKEELTACGIQSDENGYLKADDSLAVEAARDGGMESLFTRKNGFVADLAEKAEAIAVNPVEYLDKIIVTYPNTEKDTSRNPYITSIYSGLFFNSYC